MKRRDFFGVVAGTFTVVAWPKRVESLPVKPTPPPLPVEGHAVIGTAFLLTRPGGKVVARGDLVARGDGRYDVGQMDVEETCTLVEPTIQLEVPLDEFTAPQHALLNHYEFAVQLNTRHATMGDAVSFLACRIGQN